MAAAANTAERTVYEAGAGRKTALALAFLILLPFYASLPAMLARRLVHGLWFDTIGLIVFSALLMLLVLMHKGKGGGLSDMFGGGMQSSVGGSSVAERNLDRITVVVGLLWFACIVVLGILMKVTN